MLGSIRSKISKYRQQYRALTNRERERRVYSLADDVLAACIPKSKVNKDICNYIEEDNDLLIDLLTVIDNIKLRLERLTKRSFKIVNDGMTPPPQDNNNSQSSSITNFAKYYSTTLSRREYNQLREQYTKSQEMKLHDFPSYHTINKDSNRPDIVPIDLSVECDLPEVDFEAVGLDVDLNDTSYCAEMTQVLKPKITVKSFVGKKDIEMKDAIDDIKKSRGVVAKDKIMTARISGSFMKYIEMMVTTSQKKNIKIDSNKLIIIDSYDGAEHKNTTSKGKVGIISFNSQLISPSAISEVSPASTRNILTWQQVVGDEKFDTLLPALNKIYESKAAIRRKEASEGKVQHVMYDLHDGKMLYLLTQHSLFNRKHHPFLLCACQRGAGVKDKNHRCEIISDKDQNHWFQRSSRRWNLKQGRVGEGKYMVKNHMDWVDINNKGISHFGFNPSLLPRSSLRFDVFHLRGGVSRRLMTNLRNFLMGSMMEVELAEKFSDVLSKFWSDYNVLLWNLNKSFQRLVGSEILCFIRNTKLITSFLKKEFQASEVLNDLCNGLHLWEKITPFLVITKIDDVNEYKLKLNEFEKNLKELYDIGGRSFLTKNPAEVGDDETFYFHVLRFYMPHIAKVTLEEHGLGLGIFTMQGFECRNKESKNILRRFNNGIGNIVIPNLKRLWDVYDTECNLF